MELPWSERLRKLKRSSVILLLLSALGLSVHLGLAVISETQAFFAQVIFHRFSPHSLRISGSKKRRFLVTCDLIMAQEIH